MNPRLIDHSRRVSSKAYLAAESSAAEVAAEAAAAEAVVVVMVAVHGGTHWRAHGAAHGRAHIVKVTIMVTACRRSGARLRPCHWAECPHDGESSNRRAQSRG